MIIKTNNLLPGTYQSGRRDTNQDNNQAVLSLFLQAFILILASDTAGDRPPGPISI